MLVDPVQAFSTGTLLVPTTSSTLMVSPVPTIVPSLPEYQNAGVSGQRTLWVLFFLMLISSAVFTFMSWSVPVSRRLYHSIITLITIISALTYFAMANGQGKHYHHIVERESHKHVPDTTHDIFRVVYWVRYLDWMLTTSLVIVTLSLISGLSGANTVMAIIASDIMVLTALASAFGHEGTPQKWGWYTIACIAYLVVVWHLALPGRASARARGERLGGFYTAITGYILTVWAIYLIVWGVAQGARRMSVNSEIVTYAVLDILSKAVFGAWLLMTYAKLPEIQADVDGFWTHGFSRDGHIRVGDDDEGA